MVESELESRALGRLCAILSTLFLKSRIAVGDSLLASCSVGWAPVTLQRPGMRKRVSDIKPGLGAFAEQIIPTSGISGSRSFIALPLDWWSLNPRRCKLASYFPLPQAPPKAQYQLQLSFCSLRLASCWCWSWTTVMLACTNVQKLGHNRSFLSIGLLFLFMFVLWFCFCVNKGSMYRFQINSQMLLYGI